MLAGILYTTGTLLLLGGVAGSALTYFAALANPAPRAADMHPVWAGLAVTAAGAATLATGYSVS